MLVQLLLSGLWAAVASLDLPSYITPCAYDDPDLNGCALREARKALKVVVNGDSKYRIPKLDPLLIQELKVDQGPQGQAIGFSFVAYNCSMLGLSNAKALAIRLDLPKQHSKYELAFPRLEIRANYSAKGQLLLFPITGTGIANITVTDVKCAYTFNYTLEKKAEGDYATISESKLNYKLDGRVYVHLDNLLNGQKLFVDNINTVLNDNWRDLERDMGPSIAEALEQVMTATLKGMFDTVPMQKAFPGHP